MPLFKSKSKPAFEHNIKAEVAAGKPLKQALAIAYSTKRKAKKMAEGGTATGQKPSRSDLDHGQKSGPQGYPKYQEQAQNEKGIHTSVSGTTAFPGSKGESQAGSFAKDRYNGKAILNEPAKKEHRRVIEEARAMPKPKLKGLAEGGRVSPIKGPRLAHSSVFKAYPLDSLGRRLDEEEEHLETREAPASPSEQPEMWMAEGGVAEEIGPKPEEDEVEHPAGLESSDSHEVVSEKEFDSDSFADEEDDHKSIASAIMHRRKMASGGMVDLYENAEEEPNEFYHENEDAALKENYDEDIHSVTEPMDSNEHGDDLSDEDEHEHSMIAAIRRKMKSRT